MTSKVEVVIRDLSRGRACFGTGDLSTVVTVGGLPVAQLGHERGEATHGLPAVCSTIAPGIRQGGPDQEEAVAAWTVTGELATGGPFMDIGIGGVSGIFVAAATL
jgi:hypothetical protein